ncbi:MAG: PDZ domain-containing protein [Ignavibacteriae bacterium]|nr:PDZ domain-containing protein [Ignavibacteriota bacterium]
MKWSNNYFLLLLLALFIYCCSNEPLIIYVDSKLEKSIAEENKFNNLELAIAFAIEQKHENKSKNIKIKLLPGDYHLTKPIKITSDLNSLKIEGSGKLKTFIKGSRLLNLNWRKFDQNIWVAEINENIDFDQLYLNGEQQILARYPNYNENGGNWNGYAADAISIEKIKKWKNPIGGFVHITHKAEWGDFHFKIVGIDKNGEAILEGGHQNNRPENGLHPEFRMVENIFEELDSSNEYFHDKNENKIYFYPPKDIDPNKSKIEVSVLKHLIEIEGTESEPVKDIFITGISFEHTKRTFMEKYDKLLRSDWAIYRGGAILISFAEYSVISDCEFTNLGGNGIFINSYNRNIKISNNQINNCGATGIAFVGDTSAVRSPSFYYYEFVDASKMDTIRGPKNKLFPSDCIVENNLIYQIGRIEKQTTGVQISMAMNINIRNNSIYDVPRAGINVSEGTWGGHIIEYNDVFNTVLETGDHGSFNSWGRDRFWHPNRKVLDSLVAKNPDMPKWDAINTTIIRNNRFRCDHGWDIDLDDGSSNYKIYNNLCLNGGIKLREGFNRVVENNIMINNGFHPHVWFKNSNDVFRKNIVMTDHKDILVNDWGKEVDYNFFTDENSLEKSKLKNTDANSIFGNPHFLDAENLDFRISDDSPSHKIGFVNFEMNKFGVQTPELKKIAKTPEPPILINYSKEAEFDKQFEWLGASIKNISTLGERSAAGLENASGVLILSVKINSLAENAGLQKGDVIIKCEEDEIKNISDLIQIHQGNNWKGELNLVVFRNQAKVKIKIYTK